MTQVLLKFNLNIGPDTHPCTLCVFKLINSTNVNHHIIFTYMYRYRLKNKSQNGTQLAHDIKIPIAGFQSRSAIVQISKLVLIYKGVQ